MFISNKERSINPGERCDVYFNLNKTSGQFYSIRVKGLVVGYSEYVHLKDCQFVVSDKGREKVRQTKTKNVHGCVRGQYISSDPIDLTEYREINYNPYVYDYFIDLESGEYIFECYEAVCHGKRVWVKN